MGRDDVSRDSVRCSIVRIGRIGRLGDFGTVYPPNLTPRRPYPFLPPLFLSIPPLHTPSCPYPLSIPYPAPALARLPLPPLAYPYPRYPAVTQFVKSTISLLGCRANPLNRHAQEKIGKQGAAGKGCLQLNCTSHLRQYYLCAPPGARPGFDIASWRHAINRATHPGMSFHSIFQSIFSLLFSVKSFAILTFYYHPVHTFGRYEVSTKMNVAPLVPEDSGKLAYTTPGYWEPWVMGWLTRLVKLDMSPHFLQLLGTFRCNDLPGKYTGMPEEGATGIMPPYSPGGPVTRAIEQIKVDGDSFQVRG